MSDYRIETVDLAAGGAVENGVLDLGALYRTITVTRFAGLMEVKPNHGSPWIPLYQVGQVLHLGTPTKKLYYKKAAGLAGTNELFFSQDGSWIQIPGGPAGLQIDDTDKQAVSIWMKNVNPGDVAALATPAGRPQDAILATVSVGDAFGAAYQAIRSDDGGGILGSGTMLFNGTNWDRRRGANEMTVFASAARTASVNSADFVNYNGYYLRLIISVTAIAATPSVIFTLRGKDPVSLFYNDPLLASAAIVGVGTTILQIGPGLPVTANLSNNIALPRVWRLEAVHGDADSITYSVAAIIT